MTHDIITLLKPRLWSIKNSAGSKNNSGGTIKYVFIGSLGLLFWGGVFTVSLRVLKYFKGIDQIGDILAFKLLSMMIITSFALLIFSSILTALSKLYLSRDLLLVHSVPVSAHKIFIARWIDSTFDSAWMVNLYTLPVFIAYGIIYDGGFLYYINMIFALLSLSVTASALSSILVMAAVIIIPANRMKNIFVFMSILFFVVLYIAVRLMKPELLVDPEVFNTVIVYITALKTPSSPLLPTTWIFDSIQNTLTGPISSGIFHTTLSLSFSCVMLFIAVFFADALYYKGFSKSQTASVRLFKYRLSRNRFIRRLSGPVRAFMEKEVKIFFRDQTQWSQLFLIAALIVIYIYNFKVLPLERSPIQTIYLQNLLSFLNMGLALFVLTAITARFAFPAVSTETSSFWIVKSAPMRVNKFLWIKFAVYYLPLLILSESLIVITNLLLNVTPFMMVLSTVTVFLLVPGIVSLGIGLGAAYPDFKAENPTQTVTSFGGYLFMILCAMYIGIVILIESGPVYDIFMADIRGRTLGIAEWAPIICAFAAVLGFAMAAVILPIKIGARRLAGITV